MEIKMTNDKNLTTTIDQDHPALLSAPIVLGQYLRKIREDKGYSYRQASDVTGISHSYIKNVENGIDPRSQKEIIIQTDKLQKFARGYEIPYETLLEKAGIVKKAQPEISDEERNVIFISRLEQLIEENSISILKLAKKTEISMEQITEILEGTAKATIEDIYSLAAALKVTPDYLAGYTADKKGFHPDTPELNELLSFINGAGVQLYGKPLSKEDKGKIIAAVKVIFSDASQRQMEEK